MGATVSLYLYTYRTKDDGLYPLKIRVTHTVTNSEGERETKKIYLGIPKDEINRKLDKSILQEYVYHGLGDYSIKKWDFYKSQGFDIETEKATKQKGKFLELYNIFNDLKSKWQKEADKIQDFTLDKFKKEYTQKSKVKNDKNDLFTHFDNYINRLKSQNRIGTANSYNDAKESFARFYTLEKLEKMEYLKNEKDELPFNKINKEFLEDYITWMQNNKKSDSTIGMYLRAMKVMFYDTKSNNFWKVYPFHNKNNPDGLKISRGSGRIIALEDEELKKVIDYEIEGKSDEAFYLDMWKLMYFLSGINPKDLCLLKHKDYIGKRIYYIREKTKLTSKEVENRGIPVRNNAKQIIDKWKNPEELDYLLPVITKGMDEVAIKNTVHAFYKKTNKTMKRIASVLEIEKTITTYTARHSFASKLLREEAPMKYISTQLKHSNLKTTEAYLGNFPDKKEEEYQDKLTKF